MRTRSLTALGVYGRRRAAGARVASRFLYLDEATPACVGQPAIGRRLLVEETRAGGGKTVSTFDRLGRLVRRAATNHAGGVT
jgi:hypothetical protein